MRVVKPARGLGALSSLLLIVALGCDDRGECTVSGATCGAAYTLILDAAPQNLGALMISIETETSASVTVLSGRSMPASLDGQGTRRAIVIGASPLAAVARITFGARPSRPPSIIVLQAAANQSAGYGPIAPSNIRFRIDEVPVP